MLQTVFPSQNQWINSVLMQSYSLSIDDPNSDRFPPNTTRWEGIVLAEFFWAGGPQNLVPSRFHLPRGFNNEAVRMDRNPVVASEEGENSLVVHGGKGSPPLLSQRYSAVPSYPSMPLSCLR